MVLRKRPAPDEKDKRYGKLRNDEAFAGAVMRGRGGAVGPLHFGMHVALGSTQRRKDPYDHCSDQREGGKACDDAPLDGEIAFEMKATGIINTVGCRPGAPSKYGVEVAPGVEGQIHQHAFCARLEPMLDGDCNSVVECNTMVEADELNPHGNAFFVVETPLRTEQEGARTANLATQRYWRVINRSKTNHVGQPVGYKLAPANAITPFLKPASPSGRRGAFTTKHLWVTAFDPEERYPAGEFMNRSTGAGGLPDFIARDRPIEDARIVLWHVFGLHHNPRPEDFPVQPCISTGFQLMPSGFFDRNPAIDLPPDVNAASRLQGATASCCHQA